ncbi:MAG: lipid A deacylase LpxR family protein [Desulfobacterales bacterium]
MFFVRILILFLTVLCFYDEPLRALADEPGLTCSVQFENDFFGGGTDRHFTHGTRFDCLTQPIPWITNAAKKLPWFIGEDELTHPENALKTRASISIGQNIYTPEDITDPQLITEDRPYAGWLYMGFGLVANQGSRRYDKLELDIGVVGPLSFAEEVQKAWHSILGLSKPEGWDNQLENEPGINLFYEQARRLEKNMLLYGLEYDVIPHFGGSLGNVFTYAASGLTLRIGPDLDEDFGPPRIRPSLPGGGFFRSKKGVNWYVFAGVEGRAVLYNIFLDGNAFSDSHSVDKKLWVGDLQAGLTIQVHRVRISYTQIYRTKEYHKQDRADAFGSLSISYQF